MDNICLHKALFLLIIVIILGTIILIYYNDTNNVINVQSEYKNYDRTYNNTNVGHNNNHQHTQPDHQNITIDIKQNESNGPYIDPLREYDYRALNDPLVPPYKRDDYTIPPPVPLLSYPTRGYPSSFKKVGVLIDQDAENNDKYKFLLLMGRQKYVGSNYYDYYVTENDPGSALKFVLKDRNRELFTDDTVVISELNKTYVVKIDKTLGYEYYPYI